MICFTDGDNMKAWNSFCGMETTDDLMEEAMNTIQSVKPNEGHYAVWLRLKKTGDEFMCYYFTDIDIYKENKGNYGYLSIHGKSYFE